MAQYAHVIDGLVIEVIGLPDDVTPGDAFPADLAAALVTCPASVQPGWGHDGKRFFAPSGTAPPRTTEQALAELSVFRTAHMTSGCDVVLPVTGATIRVATDAETRADIERLERRVKADKWPAAGRDIRVAPGLFITATAADVIAIAQAVDTHIDACAMREAKLAKRLKTDPATDLTTGWP